MSVYLTKILDQIGFEPRPQQLALYEALQGADHTGVVAQAGTGTGKSLAVLAAAAQWREDTGRPSLVVVPLNALLQQYIDIDAPRVEEALGITIRALRGRNHYLCEAAPGFDRVLRPWAPEGLADRAEKMRKLLRGSEELVVLDPEDTEWFGCPGIDEGCDTDTLCHYRAAKAELDDADIIITNAHLLIINDQLRRLPPYVLDNGEERQPHVFPEYGALFVDEAHTLEGVLRDFATRSIPFSACDSLGVKLGDWLQAKNIGMKDAATVDPDRELVACLNELADVVPDLGEELKKNQRQAVEAARFMLMRGTAGAYRNNEAVLWLQPDSGGFGRRSSKPNPKLISTQIDLAAAARQVLTRTPFALVSGTIPKSLRNALGIPEAVFVDCGHPFDYAKQGKLRISRYSGSFKSVRANPQGETARIKEVQEAILETGGGTLCLFSSYKDMEMVFGTVANPLREEGLEVRTQTRDGDKQELGRWFKEHGNAVLFGTETFATGFDVPGDALRQVVIWKLPYPGLDPVTRAIMARSRQRYEDMMRMKVTQAAGRLIRRTEDTGTIFIVDSRAEKLIGDDDPMLAHLGDFTRSDAPRRVRAWDME